MAEVESTRPVYDSLPATDQKLIEEFLSNGMVQWTAYRDTIYSGDKNDPDKYDTIRTLASRKFTDANIQAAIAERIREAAMTADEVLKRLADQARANLCPFLHVAADGSVFFDFSHPEAKQHLHLIKKVKTKRTRKIVYDNGEDVGAWENEWVEVELYDAQSALKLIGQAQGVFGPKGTEDDPQYVVTRTIEIVNKPQAPDG